MKVEVVGGGPAGSVVSIESLQRGCEVVIYEEHPKIGVPKQCSGLISKEGIEFLSKYVNMKKLIINPIKKAEIYLMNEKIEVNTGRESAYVVDRSGLDKELGRKVEEEGGKIVYNRRITKPQQLTSKNIVGADGPLSSTASMFGFPKIKKFVFAYNTITENPYDEKDSVRLFYHPERFPGFFAWIIPHSEEKAEFGVGSTNRKKSLEGLKSLLKKYGKKEGKVEGGLIPMDFREKTAKEIGKKKVFLVGDAAGQVKFSSGGGIVFSTKCASILAKNIDNPQKYEEEWREKYMMDLYVHFLINRFFEMQNPATLTIMGKVLSLINVGKFLGNYVQMDHPTKLMERIMRTDKKIMVKENIF